MNVIKSSLAVKLFILAAACLLSTQAASAQCQNQLCVYNNMCWRCTTFSPGFGCEVKGCGTCTNTTCGQSESGNGRFLPQGQLASLTDSRKCTSATALELAALAGKIQDGTVVAILPPGDGATPTMVRGTFGDPSLLRSGTILNRSAKILVAYKLGWMRVGESAEPQIEFGKWHTLPAAIKPNESRSIVGESSPFSSGAKGAKLVQVFVAEVKYVGGTTWRQDLAEVKKAAAAITSVAGSTPRGTSL